jgi:amino acid transporter
MSDDGFTRELGLLEATSIGLGTMIGGGIFILPSIAATRAGPASAVSFVLAGLVSLLSAASHAEVATDMQASEGGGYQYVHRALGPLFGTIVGWGMLLGFVFATAFYAVGFAEYLRYVLGAVPVPLLAGGLSVVLVGLNLYGAAEAGWLEDAIVAVLLVLVVGFVALGATAVDPAQLQPVAPQGWGAVVATTGTVYVTFVGFSVIATAAAEIEHPARNLPLSMTVAVLVPTVLYALVMIVSTGVLPAEELQGSNVPVADVAQVFAGGIGALAMVVGAVLATVSSANASILGAGRVSYAMGRDRTLADWLSRLHDRFETPYRAILLTGVAILALVAAGVAIDVLAEVASFLFLLTYGMVHVAVIRLRGREDYNPEFAIPDPLYPAVPVVGLLATVAIMTQMTPIVVVGGLAVVAASVGWYFVVVRK